MFERMRSWVWDEPAEDEGGAHVEPAFSSIGQAAFFAAVVVTCLALPFTIDLTTEIPRSTSYDLVPERHGAFSYAKERIFDKEQEIDLLFVGSSAIFASFDTPRVQEELTRDAGQRVNVATFGHYFNSLDIIYMQVRDLVEVKRPKMIMISVPRIPFSDGPSALAYKFIRYHENQELLEPLPFRYHASLYACTILRSPQDLLSMIRPNLSRPSPWADSLGADKFRAAMGRDVGKFVPFSPPIPRIPATEMIASNETQHHFEVVDEPIGAYQRRYLEKLVELLAEKQVPLVFVSIPFYTERHSSKIFNREDWRKSFPTVKALIGIPPTTLFKGLTEEEVKTLYFDEIHLNANGNRLFTEALMPAIREVYKHNARNN